MYNPPNSLYPRHFEHPAGGYATVNDPREFDERPLVWSVWREIPADEWARIQAEGAAKAAQAAAAAAVPVEDAADAPTPTDTQPGPSPVKKAKG